jgi:hypothetical protein
MIILVYRARKTGDTIISTHCARILKRKYNAEIIFATSSFLLPLIEPTPWLDVCIAPPKSMERGVLSQAASRTPVGQTVGDAVDEVIFERLQSMFSVDMAVFPKWKAENSSIPYKAPFMWRSFCNSVGLTQEEANDTEYELSISEKERDMARAWWKKKGFLPGERFLLHKDWLDDTFNILLVDGWAALLNTEYKSWRQNLAIMAEADYVITRYGGVAVASAAVRTPTIIIPKPEPAWWANPIYSHPNDGHVMIWPKAICDGFNDQHQPCMPGYGSYDFTNCPLKFSDHCWTTVTVEDIVSHIRSVKVV